MTDYSNSFVLTSHETRVYSLLDLLPSCSAITYVQYTICTVQLHEYYTKTRKSIFILIYGFLKY